MDILRKLADMEISSKLYRIVFVITLLLVVTTLAFKCRIKQPASDGPELGTPQNTEISVTQIVFGG